jgi:transcription-repair coupling factor (superfamily II helicase)
VGDFVVHIENGIGRYDGLKTLDIAGAAHDCLQLQYAGDSKLYLPVENIDLLTRYGSETDGVQLDRMGGAAWQSRKAKAKQRLREMAEGLIALAAKRMTRTTGAIDPPGGAFDEFCARFPYEETDDQLNAVGDVLEDLGAGRPMDRLICGDVGFGKTEVALRAAFVVAMTGQQVALVCPTTLLARQHFKTFRDRFNGWPIKVRLLSRLVTAKEAEETRQALKKGEIELVIGTHALLSKQVEFKDLGLVIVDEEQHFGVKHKERLKELRADVHMLTLTATPIPRTLQMALTGIREMSIIATPPVDRLAVRTYVMPFDGVTLREALLREKYRGRAGVRGGAADQGPAGPGAVPARAGAGSEVRGRARADDAHPAGGRHGRLLRGRVRRAAVDDHRGERAGRAQRQHDDHPPRGHVRAGAAVPAAGRVGRSKTRAYAYMVTPNEKQLTIGAEKRLKVLQSLDSLGAGFQLASHDLDIRGGGNLLGDEQSGHIKEIGVELYQQMLEDAVNELKAGGAEVAADARGWSPQINAGVAVLIPETYVPDLDVRLSLYRRLSDAEKAEDREALAAELIDRFGPLPEEADALLRVVGVKGLCRQANVAKIDVGPKGAVVKFLNNDFANPRGW